MWSRIRTLTLWLLLAALPVQSWAIATMMNCGPTHHRMTSQAADAAPVDHHAHDHASSHHGDAVADLSDDDRADSDLPPLSLGKFKCSACATCCLGMALPMSGLSLEAGVASDTVSPGIAQRQVVFLTAGLERPPRTFLA